VNHAEGMNIKRIERFTKQLIPATVVEGFEPKRSAPAARTSARPGGWKPGDGRSAAKPGQRSFSKPGAPREGGYSREGGHNAAPRGPSSGAPRREGSGGYRGSNPRSTDGARRSFGDN
jgi:hypothetical protein